MGEREVGRVWERGRLGGCGREGGGEGVEERGVGRVWERGRWRCYVNDHCRGQGDTESPCGNRAVRCPDSRVDSALLQETRSGLGEEPVEKRGRERGGGDRGGVAILVLLTNPDIIANSVLV